MMHELILATCFIAALLGIYAIGFITGIEFTERRWREWVENDRIRRWVKVVKQINRRLS